MGAIPQYNRLLPNSTSSNTHLPFAIQYPTSESMNQNEETVKNRRFKDRFIYRKSTDYPLDTTYTPPISGIAFKNVDNTSVSLDYQVYWEADIATGAFGLRSTGVRSVVGITLNALHTALMRYTIANNLTITTYLQVSWHF